jgi:hypothetical protein
MKPKRVGILCAAVLACASFVACSGSTVAAYINAVGTSVNAIIAAELPNWAGAAPLKALFTQAAADAGNWTAGTKSQEFTTVLNDLATALDNVPINPKIDEYVSLGVAAIDGILALTTAEGKVHTLSQQTDVFVAWVDSDSAASPPATQRKHVWKGSQPKTLKQFNQQLKKLRQQASKKG